MTPLERFTAIYTEIRRKQDSARETARAMASRYVATNKPEDRAQSQMYSAIAEAWVDAGNLILPLKP